MAQTSGTETFILPRKLFKNDFAFGIDFGSSIIKVAYTTKEGDNLTIHIVNFATHHQTCVTQCVQFLKEITAGKLKPGGDYFLTGVGIAKHLKAFEEGLNIKSNILSEQMEMVDGFIFFAENLSWHDFVYPTNAEMRKKIVVDSQLLVKCSQPTPGGMFQLGRSETYTWVDVLANIHQDEKVHYPILLSLVGSGHYIFKIEEDGFMRFLDTFPIAGKTILGLGNLLLGEKNFDDIFELASKVDAANLDVTLGMAIGGNDDGVYGAMQDSPVKLFSFGLAALGDDKEKFNRESIASSLVSMVAHGAARDAFNHSVIENVKQVFFVGGIPSNNNLFRMELEKEFIEKSHANSKQHVCDCLFVKGGGHLAAIGALIKNLVPV